jgi:type IV pilus assembly protein PilC
MAMLLKASVPLNRAIKLAAGSITNDYLRERLERLASEVEKGKKLSTLLANLEEIPTLFTNMVATGEESGTLDITFEKLSQIYEKRTYRTIDFWVSMIEPLTIIAIAVIVGIIVVSIMLPLVEITSGQFLK